METDFCEPVRLDRANVPSHDKLNKELVVYRINAFNQEFYLNPHKIKTLIQKKLNPRYVLN